MRILIAGGGAFCTQFIARLNRERHDVYLIRPKSAGAAPGSDTGCTAYYFDLGDDKLSFVISSVKPDIIVFMGAMSDDYDWRMAQKSSSSLLSGLSNMLCMAAANEVSRFVYLSSADVYGTRYNQRLDETMAKSPEDVKGLILSQGEELCAGFGAVTGLPVLSLRFSQVYGMIADGHDDFVTKLLCAAADAPASHAAISFDDITFSPLYVSDAVDAVYKAVTASGGTSGLFNVAGQTADMRSVCLEINRIIGSHIPVPEPSAKQAPVLTVDYKAFSESFGFRAIVNLQNGLSRTCKAFDKARKQEAKRVRQKEKGQRGANILKIIVPILENVIVFAIIIGLFYLSSGYDFLTNIDFFILYIVIIGVTFGGFQAAVAVLLSCCFFLWRESGFGPASAGSITGIDILIRFLQYFIIGALCGYKTDRMNTKLDEKKLEMDDVEAELNVIYEINDKNMRIKQLLDNRLSNYENSMAKIYSVTDRLNSLQVDEIYFSAINAVTEIMNSNDVSIYIVTGSANKMCRLVAKSPQSDRALRKSIPLDDFGELAVSMERDEIFVNRDLQPNMPIMAAPIFSARSLVSIIMLWTVEFEELTVYNTNNFLVLSKLISSIIEKAYVHLQATIPVNYLEDDADVLKPEAFMEILRVHMKAEKEGVAQYRIFGIDTTDVNPAEITTRIKRILRNTDYLGWTPDGGLQILLTNTNENDAKFVFDRLRKADIVIKGVEI